MPADGEGNEAAGDVVLRRVRELSRTALTIYLCTALGLR